SRARGPVAFGVRVRVRARVRTGAGARPGAGGVVAGTREPHDVGSWYATLRERVDGLDAVMDAPRARPTVEEVGEVLRVEGGIAEVSGLPDVTSEELVQFPGGRLGMAYDLRPDRVGVILVDEVGGLAAGDLVRRTGQVMSTPVGEH